MQLFDQSGIAGGNGWGFQTFHLPDQFLNLLFAMSGSSFTVWRS